MIIGVTSTQDITKNTSNDFNSARLFFIEVVREGAFRKELGLEMEFELDVLCDESTSLRN